MISPLKNVYIVNNTGQPVTLVTTAGSYTFTTGGTLPVPVDGSITIQAMTGVHDIKALTSMPSGTIDTFLGKSQGQVITLSSVATTNYLWLNAQ